MNRIIQLCAMVGLAIVMSACSTINRYNYYKADVVQLPSYPQISQSSARVTLVYKNDPRSIFQKSHQQLIAIGVSDYSRAVYTVGPIFVPIIPVFNLGGDPPLDLSNKIRIQIGFSSDKFYPETIKKWPELFIKTIDGRILKPEPVQKADLNQQIQTFAIYTYDAKMKDNPNFILQASEVPMSNGSVLKIPEMKFELTSELQVNWNEQVAP